MSGLAKGIEGSLRVTCEPGLEGGIDQQTREGDEEQGDHALRPGLQGTEDPASSLGWPGAVKAGLGG